MILIKNVRTFVKVIDLSVRILKAILYCFCFKKKLLSNNCFACNLKHFNMRCLQQRLHNTRSFKYRNSSAMSAVNVNQPIDAEKGDSAYRHDAAFLRFRIHRLIAETVEESWYFKDFQHTGIRS